MERLTIEAHEYDEHYRVVARLLQVNTSSAYSIMRRHDRPKDEQRMVQMDNEMKDTLIFIIEETADYSLMQINQALQK